MNKTSFSLLIVSALFLFVSIQAQPVERDPKLEAPLLAELEGIAPEAVDKFVAATQALDNGNYGEAELLFTQVLESAPDFQPALRRQGYTLASSGNRTKGLELAQKAIDIDRSVDNLAGKASILLGLNIENFKASEEDVSEAYSLAGEAWEKSNESDEFAASLMSEIMLLRGDFGEFERFSYVFKQKFPESLSAGYYYALTLANNGNFSEAREELARIQALGFPEDVASQILAAMDQADDEAYFGLGRFFKYVNVFLILVAVWAIGLATLFFVGKSLSKRTMDLIEGSDPNELTGTSYESLRKLYRKVITLAGIYYYVSQPVVILIVIVAALAVFIFFLWVGRIPIYLMLGLAVVSLGSIFYMVKSWVTRVKIEDPGRVLNNDEAPQLWELVRKVAETINTRPVDEIRLTHGTEVAVYERGSFRKKLTDNAERVLVLGMAALNDFDLNAFRAVLAHEYGHFSNRDTAGGEIALRVNIDIERVASSMINSGTATYYNLGFHFLRLFDFLFRRITHGATRLQEVLADRVAAYHFGTDAFREGLSHVIRREVEFNKIADNEVNSAMAAKRPLANLYDLALNDEASKLQADEDINILMNRPTTDDDTHPSPKDRFRYIENIKTGDIVPLQGNVWDLFEDREAVTKEMTDLIDNLVSSQFTHEDGSILGI